LSSLGADKATVEADVASALGALDPD